VSKTRFKHLNRIIVRESATLKDVLKRFNETALHTENKGFSIITNDTGQCIGVATDGDIRRKITAGISINAPIKQAMNKNFSYIFVNDAPHKALRKFDQKISNLPVLNDEMKPVDLYQYSNFVVSTRSETRIIRARVPVRISFSGGGTDISNYINQTSSAVLSSSINKYCTTSVIIRQDEEIHINSKDLNLSYSVNNLKEIAFGDELDLIKAAIRIMEPDYGFDLETFAEFEPGTGLGGSSAVVVSVLGTLNYFRNERQLDIYQLADVAYQVERIDMGIYGGWQDQYATAFGGFSWIEFRQNEIIVTPLMLQKETVLELEYNLMLFRIGGNRRSSEIQKKFISQINNNKEKFKLFSQMSELAVQMKEALLKGELKTFGNLLHESWVLKQKINNCVTNKVVVQCYHIAKSLGALGGKLLGAGQCGYLLLYASPKYQKQIIGALSQKGAIHESFKFSQNGLEVWSTKQ
jgi:D-glycero-alpha-D-manno-heptose-7-phosphate kinase